MPVLLWTDILIYLLVLAVITYAWYVRGREHLRAPWRQVARNRIGMAAAVVLAAYIVIGLLDSIHFRPRTATAPDPAEAPVYSTQIISMFDYLVGPLRTRVEKTYSAPLAAYQYTKDVIELPDGSQVRDYPRLQYGGAHLKDPGREHLPDVLKRTGIGLGKGLILWLALSALLVHRLALRAGVTFFVQLTEIVRRRTAIPWDVLIYTGGGLLMLAFVLIELSAVYHVLGTDKVGQDVLYLALKSIRTGLIIGTLTTLIMLPFAILLGIAAGYFGGLVDDIVQYTYTTLVSIPGVLLIAAAVLMLQVYMAVHAEDFASLEARADLRLLFLCIVLGVTSWTGLCRLLRGEALKLREIEYVQAAQALGVGHFTILMRHILPNVMHIVMITVVLDFSALVLAEAVLSYINIGVDPTMHSWGNMINSARLEMAREPVVWWSLAAAFFFMLGLVLAANLFADAVRDAFDPRLRVLGT